MADSFNTSKMNLKSEQNVEEKNKMEKEKAKRMRMRIGMKKFKILNYLCDKRYRSA